jgi:hypothetical protein
MYACDDIGKFFLEREIFQTLIVDNIKTYILCLTTFFRKSCRLLYNVEKYSRARQATLFGACALHAD